MLQVFVAIINLRAGNNWFLPGLRVRGGYFLSEWDAGVSNGKKTLQVFDDIINLRAGNN